MNQVNDGSRWPLGQRGPIRLRRLDMIPTEPTEVVIHPGYSYDVSTLALLIEHVRADIGWLALSTLVHTSTPEHARKFIREISPLLHAPDAVVVTPPTPNLLDEIEGDARPVPLDFETGSGFGVYQSLDDVVFFCGTAEDVQQETRLTEFLGYGREARAIIIYEKGPFAHELMRMFLRNGNLVYGWSKETNVTEYHLVPAQPN